jgi:hypothetical protein
MQGPVSSSNFSSLSSLVAYVTDIGFYVLTMVNCSRQFSFSGIYTVWIWAVWPLSSERGMPMANTGLRNGSKIIYEVSKTLKVLFISQFRGGLV